VCFESRADERAGDFGVTGLDHGGAGVVVGHVQLGPWVEGEGDLGLGIGEAGHAVEEKLETEVVSGTHDGARDVEVAVGEQERVVEVGSRDVDGGLDGVEVLGGSANAGQGEGFDSDDAPDFEQVHEVGAPGGVEGVAIAEEEREGFGTRGFAPVGDDGTGAVADDDESEGMEPCEGGAQGDAVDAELVREVPFGGEAPASGEASEEDFFSEGVDEPVGDGGFVDGEGEDR